MLVRGQLLWDSARLCGGAGWKLARTWILEIEIQGALKVKEKFPETLLLFVTPPTAKELKHRLVGRGTETMDVIEFRMNRAKEEAEAWISMIT